MRAPYDGGMPDSETAPSPAVSPVHQRSDTDPGGRRRDRSWPDAPTPLPHPVIDNHCHLDFADGDEHFSVAEHVRRAAASNVTGMITIGSDMEAARWTAELMASPERPKNLLGGVALHPNEAALHARGYDHDGRELEDMDSALAKIDSWARMETMAVVGETGLDWFRTSRRDEVARKAQIDAFRFHIALAKELGKPMQIHDRNAHQDVLDILDADGAPERTVLHCFSGDGEFARACLERGFYLSFAGNITFKNADDLREGLAKAGLGRIMVETDAPFLTPVPYRGRPNSSYLIPLTMAQIAETTGTTLEAACQAIDATTREVYSWPTA